MGLCLEQMDLESGSASSNGPAGPPPIPTLVCSRFLIQEQIGSGSYSVVHRAQEIDTNEELAVKLEWVNAPKGRRLLAEAKLYKAFGSSQDVPRVLWAGRQGGFNIMVMDMQGPSLDDLFTACNRKFSLKTVLMLALQMLDRIEFVHSRSVIHRDIKPHNFLIGRGELCDHVVIMDFGLAKYYQDRSGNHIPCTERRGVTGTVRYTSLNVHNGLEPSRRDDVEAIGFVLLHFLMGGLPWQGLKARDKRHKHEVIKKYKQTTPVEELCDGCPYEFVCWMKHCRSLEHHQEPNYEYLRTITSELYLREGFPIDNIFDWTDVEDDIVKQATNSLGMRRRSDGMAASESVNPSLRSGSVLPSNLGSYQAPWIQNQNSDDEDIVPKLAHNSDHILRRTASKNRLMTGRATEQKASDRPLYRSGTNRSRVTRTATAGSRGRIGRQTTIQTTAPPRTAQTPSLRPTQSRHGGSSVNGDKPSGVTWKPCWRGGGPRGSGVGPRDSRDSHGAEEVHEATTVDRLRSLTGSNANGLSRSTTQRRQNGIRPFQRDVRTGLGQPKSSSHEGDDMSRIRSYDRNLFPRNKATE